MRFKYGQVVQCVVHLDLLFYNNTELSVSNVSEEEDGGDAHYPIDRPLDASELFSLSEVVSERLQLWN